MFWCKFISAIVKIADAIEIYAKLLTYIYVDGLPDIETQRITLLFW
jgi:hypothetical protein